MISGDIVFASRLIHISFSSRHLKRKKWKNAGSKSRFPRIPDDKCRSQCRQDSYRSAEGHCLPDADRSREPANKGRAKRRPAHKDHEINPHDSATQMRGRCSLDKRVGSNQCSQSKSPAQRKNQQVEVVAGHEGEKNLGSSKERCEEHNEPGAVLLIQFRRK